MLRHIPTNNTWKSMISRCSINNKNYQRYKEKGITVCERWKSYNLFVADMGHRPASKTLDRIDNNKGYYLENCRWADWHTQENNKDGLTKISYNGNEYTIGQLCHLLKLTLKQRQRAYKRWHKYNCTTFNELFVADNLTAYRHAQRKNLCLQCGRTKSCKWRLDGKQCNTCWCRSYKRDRAKLVSDRLQITRDWYNY